MDLGTLVGNAAKLTTLDDPKTSYFFACAWAVTYGFGVKLGEPRLNTLVQDPAEHAEDPEPTLVLHTQKVKGLLGDCQKAISKPGATSRVARQGCFSLWYQASSTKDTSPPSGHRGRCSYVTETAWLEDRCLPLKHPCLRTSSPYFLPRWLKANKQRKKNQITEVVIYLPFKSLTRFDYLNKSIWIRFKFQGTQSHSAYHDSHLPLHMVILITRMLLCAPLCWQRLTVLHTRRDWEKGEQASEIIFAPQWVPCNTLVCEQHYKSFQWKMSLTETRNSLVVLREKDTIYQIWRKRRVCFGRGLFFFLRQELLLLD